MEDPKNLPDDKKNINPAVYYPKTPQEQTALLINKLFVDLQSKFETFNNDERLKTTIATHMLDTDIK